MKLYVVTHGDYSEYSIERVFSNLEAAEEYRKWRNISNVIEEYEIYDKPFDNEDGERVMFIRVQGTVKPEAVVDIKVDISPNMIFKGQTTRGAGIMSPSGSVVQDVFTIYLYRGIPADVWNEEKYRARFTKAIYDLAGMAKAMFAEGATVDMVNAALRGYEVEE